jgi:hypothetical protein
LSEPQNIRTGNKELACQILAFFADDPGDAINFGVMFDEDTPYLTRLQPQHFRARELGQCFGGDSGLYRTTEAIRGKSEALAHCRARLMVLDRR